MPHIPALDGLRGIAVLGILLFHAGHLRGGWLGVDLFFVLSGFLITSLLLAELDSTGKISLQTFWARRARRLIPALLLFLLGIAAYAVMFAESAGLARIRADGFAALFYVANWHAIWAGQEYWDLFRSPSPLDHTWSLAIEEQFYLLWPPMVVFGAGLSRNPVRAVALAAGVLAIASAVWMALLFDEAEGSARVYFGTDTRAAATLVGAVLASVLRPAMRDWPQQSMRAADAMGIAALVLLAWSWQSVDGADAVVYRGGLFFLQLSVATVMFGVVMAPQGVTARGLAFPPLRYLGVLSYGVYLWHWPIYLVLTPERIGIGGATLTILRIAATLLVAGLSYLLVERPVRRGAISSRYLAPMGVVGVGLVSCALLAATVTDAPSQAQASQQSPGVRPEGRADIILIGDSVAQKLGPALVERAAARGMRATALGLYGCLVMESSGTRRENGLVVPGYHCMVRRTAWRDAVADQSPQVVLIVEAGSRSGDRRVANDWLTPCTPAYDAAYLAGTMEEISFFAKHGAASVIAQVPARYVGWGNGPENERLLCQSRLQREVARKSRAHIVDMYELVCPDGRCRRKIGDTTLRSDGLHFDGPGAVLAADWLLDRLIEMGLLRDRTG